MGRILHSLRLARVAAVVVLLAGCTAGPPVQEMSDARQAIAAAKEAGAATYAPDGLNAAEAKLAVAETDLQKHDYHAAHRSAVSAKDAALDALLKSRSRRDAAGAVPAAGAPAGSVPGGKAPSP